MTEPTAGGSPGSTVPCPWCSAAISPDVERCPSCGAAVRDSASGGPEIPGVTQVDPAMALKREPPRASRIVNWISGEVDAPPPSVIPNPLASSSVPGPAAASALGPAGPESFAPPSADVRREMARLELEAIRAELESRGPEAAPPSSATSDGPASDAAEPGGDAAPA